MKGKKAIVVEAPIWRRLAAFLCDYLILSIIILVPLDRLMQALLPTTTIRGLLQASAEMALPLFILLLISGIIASLYFIVLEQRLRQSVGKIVFNLEIMTLPKKELLSYKQASIRTIGVLMLYLFPLVSLFDAIYALFNKDKQRYLERITKTKVVMKAYI